MQLYFEITLQPHAKYGYAELIQIKKYLTDSGALRVAVSPVSVSFRIPVDFKSKAIKLIGTLAHAGATYSVSKIMRVPGP